MFSGYTVCRKAANNGDESNNEVNGAETIFIENKVETRSESTIRRD